MGNIALREVIWQILQKRNAEAATPPAVLVKAPVRESALPARSQEKRPGLYQRKNSVRATVLRELIPQILRIKYACSVM